MAIESKPVFGFAVFGHGKNRETIFSFKCFWAITKNINAKSTVICQWQRCLQNTLSGNAAKDRGESVIASFRQLQKTATLVSKRDEKIMMHFFDKVLWRYGCTIRRLVKVLSPTFGGS